MIDLRRDGDVFVLTLTAGENRWTTTFTRAFDAALDEVANTPGEIALVTASADPKFFSNGLDLEWIMSKGDHPGGDRKVFAAEAMALFARVMTFPVPTVCALGGHAFGAGFMVALCHDARIMRADRGFLCANEIEIGMAIPEPELALFRHKMSLPDFHRTVMLAKRWSAPEAVHAGFIDAAVPADEVLPAAIEHARRLAPLARNRAVFAWMKEHVYGEENAINRVEGPAHLLRNPDRYPSGPGLAAH